MKGAPVAFLDGFFDKGLCHWSKATTTPRKVKAMPGSVDQFPPMFPIAPRIHMTAPKAMRRIVHAKKTDRFPSLVNNRPTLLVKSARGANRNVSIVRTNVSRGRESC